jgi:hypothetical protein
MTRRLFAGLALLACFGASPSVLAPHVAGPPPAHTGGFSEPTCRTCHLGLALNDPRGSLEIEGLDESYEPGATHRISLTVRGEGMGGAGFQAAFRVLEGDQRGAAAGRVIALDEHTRVVADPATGIEYIQHTGAGTGLVNGVGQWVIEWVAPEDDVTVALHVAANSANGDNSPLEDLILTRSLELRPRREDERR